MLEDSAVKMSVTDDQQFCLRWNNFQAYITSQFEALRDDEDFVDVTLACEGQRLGAHKVVLSACSPFFKELFKVCIFLHSSSVLLRWLHVCIETESKHICPGHVLHFLS